MRTANFGWIFVLAAPFGVIAACGGADEEPLAAASGTGSPSSGSVASTGATGPGGGGGSGPACAMSYGVDFSAEAKPGATVDATFHTDEAGPTAYTVSWTVTKGALDMPTGPTVTWTLPTDVAIDVAETADIIATATAPGCPDLTVPTTVTLDWSLADRTLILENPNVVGSADVAAYYAAFRGIAADHRCAVASADTTTLDGGELAAYVDAVMACVNAVGAHIQYIVPTFGVPYKVTNRIDDIANNAVKATVCLDALLAYGAHAKSMTEAEFSGLYQDGDSMTATFNPYVPFGPLRAGPALEKFLVARIDGADADAAKALVDRTQAAEMLAQAGMLDGTVYVDGNRGLPHPVTDDFGSYESGEWNIIGVETVFNAAALYPVVADYDNAEFGTAPAPLTCPDALYYAGWYSYGNYNDVFTWNPGAIGGHLDSCSACDIRGNQDWSARALQKGITATFGAVNEPYVAGMPEYDQLFAYLLQGATFGEAGYEATRIGGWMMVWVGDPLYRPYPTP